MADLSTLLKPNNTSLNLYCKNAILDGTNVLNELATLQQEIDNIPGGNPNVWINGAGETTTNQQILFTDNSQNGAITSDKLYFDTENNFIYLNGEVMPVRSEIDFLQQEINDTNVRIDGVDNTLLNQSHRIDDLETLTTNQGNDITTLQGQVSTNTSDISTINSRLKQNLSNYYVSATSGNDTTGDGSITNAWATIDKAIAVLSAISGDIQAAVNLSAGTYNTTLTITKSGISIIGASSALPNLTVINGSLTWNMNVGTGLYSAGGIQNCQINGNLTQLQTNTYTNSFSVLNCLIFASVGKGAIATAGIGGLGTLGDMTIQGCSIYASSAIAVAIDGTAISMINTLITNSPLLSVGTASFVSVGGRGRINLFGCSLIQTSSASTVDALVLVNNSSNSASPAQINSCILVYTSSASDAGTGNKACIKFTGSASMNTYTVINNYLLCIGATTNSPNSYCIQRTGTASLSLIIGQNIAYNGFHNVPASSGAYSKTTLSTVI